MGAGRWYLFITGTARDVVGAVPYILVTYRQRIVGGGAFDAPAVPGISLESPVGESVQADINNFSFPGGTGIVPVPLFLYNDKKS